MALAMLDLRADAIVETDRVANARRFRRESDAHALARKDIAGPLVTRARRSGTRRILGRRILLIWRLRSDNAAGRAVEACLVAFLVEVDGAPQNARDRDWVRALVRGFETLARGHMDRRLAQWREAASAITGPFVAVRVAREHAIAAYVPRRSVQAFQDGLFDRRGERAYRGQAVESTELAAQLSERLAAALEASPARARLGELLLVLTP
jgi:hypothetical protein